MAARLACLVFALLAACRRGARVIAVDVDGVVHPVTVEIFRTPSSRPAARGSAASDPPEHARRPDGRHAPDHREDRRLAGAGGHLRHAQRRARRLGRLLPALEAGDVAAMAPGTNTGAAAPGAAGRRDGRRDAAEGGERRRRLPAQPASPSAAATARWPRRRCSRASRSPTRKRSRTSLIDLIARDERDLLRQLDGREITRFDGAQADPARSPAPPSWRTSPPARADLSRPISDPNIALILLVLGALGIYVEFSSPGLDRCPAWPAAFWCCWGCPRCPCCPSTGWARRCCCWRWRCSCWRRSSPRTACWARAARSPWCWARVLLVDSPLPEMRIRWRPPSASRCRSRSSRSSWFRWWCARGANKVVTGAAGMIGEIGVAHHGARARRARSSCTENIGTPSSPSRWPPAPASGSPPSRGSKLKVEPV